MYAPLDCETERITLKWEADLYYEIVKRKGIVVIKAWNVLVELLAITIGSALLAFGINDLIVPAHLLVGGLTGICVIFYHFFHWPVGTQYFLFNIPLLLLGFRFVGKKFLIYTIYAVVLSSILFDWIPIHPVWTHNVLLQSLFGGAIAGFGSALMLRFGGSSGGLDIPAKIMMKWRGLPIDRFFLVVNAAVIIVSAYMFNTELALYTLISIFVSAKSYEFVLNHVNKLAVTIVTDLGEEIVAAITQELPRGVTTWPASGGYTGASKHVVFCVIISAQMPDLGRIVKRIDKEAFVSVSPAKNVIGQFLQVW